MRLIPLAAIPNQSFSVRLDNTRMVLRIKEARGVMIADFERAGVVVLSGIRLLVGEPLIPYHYLEEGNFIVLTLNDELPDWRQFGISQMLVYVTIAEVQALIDNPPNIGSLFDRSGYKQAYLTDDAGFYLTDDAGELLIEG